MPISEEVSTAGRLKVAAPGGLALAASLVLVGYTCASTPSSRPRVCTGGMTQPLELREVRQALREEGFRVYRDHTTDCPSQIAELLDNTFFEGPHENIEQHNEIGRTQGNIGCEVDRRPAPAEQDDPAAIKMYTTGKRSFEIVMANVACTLYPASETWDTRKQALLRAFRSLASSLQ
jgi:hypothetical protein